MTSVTVTTVLNGYLVSRENEQGHEEIRVALDAQGLVDAVRAFGGRPELVIPRRSPADHAANCLCYGRTVERFEAERQQHRAEAVG